MEAEGRVSPNSGSADHEAGTGRGSGVAGGCCRERSRQKISQREKGEEGSWGVDSAQLHPCLQRY